MLLFALFGIIKKKDVLNEKNQSLIYLAEFCENLYRVIKNNPSEN
jgi:hypothetical protein